MFDSSTEVAAAIGAGGVLIGALISMLTSFTLEWTRGRREGRQRLHHTRWSAYTRFVAAADTAYGIVTEVADLKTQYRLWKGRALQAVMGATELGPRVLEMRRELPLRLAELRLSAGDRVVEKADNLLEVLNKAGDVFDRIEMKQLGAPKDLPDWDALLDELKSARSEFIEAARRELKRW